jgi:hypothetical protein
MHGIQWVTIIYFQGIAGPLMPVAHEVPSPRLPAVVLNQVGGYQAGFRGAKIGNQFPGLKDDFQ